MSEQSKRTLKVVTIQAIHPTGVDLLKSHGMEVIEIGQPKIATLIQETSDADAIIVRTFPLPGEVIRSCTHLRVIGRHGVGVDNIDVAAATERGIPVVYAPGVHTGTVVEHTLTLMLAVAKRLIYSDGRLRQGQWKVRDEYLAVDLSHKVLGIIGFGRIGSEVARRAMAAFDMKVIAYDPYVHISALSERPGLAVVELTPHLDHLLQESDVISIHAHSSEETRGLIGRREIERMKPGAFLINTSRGANVDERALISALKEGKIAGAGLDVFESEPPTPENPLFELPNVVVTPHMAGLTREGVIGISVTTVQGVVDVLEGKKT